MLKKASILPDNGALVWRRVRGQRRFSQKPKFHFFFKHFLCTIISWIVAKKIQQIWTMPQMAALKVWISSIPILTDEVSDLILTSVSLDLQFEGNIGWEQSEKMDLDFSQREHRAKNTYQVFKNQDFWPMLGQKQVLVSSLLLTLA